jgi:hypothetical protein
LFPATPEFIYNASFFEVQLHQLRCEGISKSFPPIVPKKFPSRLSFYVAV